MFLLNSLLIAQYIEEENGCLSIKDHEPKNLQHTFYYFTLGEYVTLSGKTQQLSNKDKDRFFTLQPNDFATIVTHERFRLSGKVLGMLGQSSEMATDGLQILHSPFIDPYFDGRLKFGIKNLNNIPIDLEFKKSKIGKVCFFDISDTYPIKIKKASDFYKKHLVTSEE